MIKTGLDELEKEIKKMSQNEIKIERPEKMVGIV